MQRPSVTLGSMRLNPGPHQAKYRNQPFPVLPAIALVVTTKAIEEAKGEGLLRPIRVQPVLDRLDRARVGRRFNVDLGRKSVVDSRRVGGRHLHRRDEIVGARPGVADPILPHRRFGEIEHGVAAKHAVAERDTAKV